MRYVSTRGQAPQLNFDDIVIAGLAPDGGLYLPEAWPALSGETVADLAGRPYAEVAAAVMRPFLAGSCALEVLDELCARAYARFDRAGVCPLIQLDEGAWLQELFHGPSLAFKDLAMQMLGELFDHILARRDRRITLVAATSGDTGSAAIEACRNLDRVDLFVLHPKDRISEVQRRQMTTVEAANIHNIAVEGTFDDCQAIVKAMFADREFREAQGLGAVNSINFARVLAQIVYYVSAGAALGAPHRPLAFAVPTGNFGNVFAGYAARRMGLPVARLIVASNSNDILTRFFETGRMEAREVVATLSPSMDIQVSSNFERLLYDLFGGDGAQVVETMAGFRDGGRFALSPAQHRAALDIFTGARYDDAQTVAAIGEVYRRTGLTIDPHSAVAVAAARDHHPAREIPTVALATAHPAKFPDAVAAGTGVRPALPARLADLHERAEHCVVLPNDTGRVAAHVRAHSRAGARARSA